MKIRYLILSIILIIIIAITTFMFEHYQKDNKEEVKIPVLLYHDFVTEVPDTDSDNFNYINTPQSFEENIKILLQNGYTFISIKELNNAINGKISLPEKPILVSMDDGYYSIYEYIYPILQKYNVTSSIFIITDNMGKEIDGKKYLGWNECIKMQNSNLVKIFSHGKRHIFYDKLSIRQVRDEVMESYKIIENNLGNQDLKVFAYPYGAYTKETVWVLKKNGIDFQIYDIGMNYFNKFNKNYIKRINIPCEMTGNEIIQEIEKS